jgi:ATP-dependent DNA helicase MPH1
MSSDYFDDENISPEVFEELDAIEAAYFSPSKLPPPRRLQSVSSHQSSSDGFGFDIDESELARLDKFIEDEYNAKSVPAPGRTNIGLGAPSMQTNLFGEVIPSSSTSKSQKVAPPKRLERTQPTSRNPFGQQARKTKVWDHTEYAKTGFKRTKSKGKEKQKGVFTDDHEEYDEPEEFEQFPAPLMLPGKPLICAVSP